MGDLFRHRVRRSLRRVLWAARQVVLWLTESFAKRRKAVHNEREVYFPAAYFTIEYSVDCDGRLREEAQDDRPAGGEH